MFEDKATIRNCALLLSFDKSEGGGFNISSLHSIWDRARVWSRRLVVGSCIKLLGVRERKV
jgi:hypothetical protein